LQLWGTTDRDWFPITYDALTLPRTGRQVRNYTFLEFSTAGQALLEKVRANYKADESEYQPLLAFNDKYAGLERLLRVPIIVGHSLHA